MSMIPSSGFFVAPQLPSETHDSGLDCLCEPADGSCILLKGSREDRLVVYKALKAACKDKGVIYVDNSEIVEQYMSTLYDSDGVHLRPAFYPLWAKNLYMATILSDTEE